MRRVSQISVAVMVGALVTSAFAQPGVDKKVPQPVKPEIPKAPAKPEAPKLPEAPKAPKAPEAPKMPEGQPDMQEMMKAWEAASTPGKEHAHLAKGAGTWDGKVKMWMAPGAPPTESVCTTVMQVTMGGRFVRGETKGDMDMGMGPQPFEGFGVYGYNNTTKNYESTWCDNFGTCMIHFTGKASEDGKTITWNGKFIDPMSGKETWMREVETHTGADTMTLEMFGPSPDGKGDMKMMHIDYTRKAAAGAKDVKPATGTTK